MESSIACPTHLSIEVIFILFVLQRVNGSREGAATRVRGGRGNDWDILDAKPRESVSEATGDKSIILGHGGSLSQKVMATSRCHRFLTLGNGSLHSSPEPRKGL